MWQERTKHAFIDHLEIARSCPILSINIYSEEMNNSQYFIGSLSVILEKRRDFFVINQESSNLSQNVDIETDELELMYIID